ncbi:hypothetical protein MRX96_000967 [Rhipicephalus microplus]
MTWTGRSVRSRIDRFYVSPSLAPRMHSSWSVSSALSDHCLLTLRLAGTDIAAQGKRPWRLNARLLKDREILVDVARLIQRKVHATPELDGDKWDEVKADATECFRSWGKRRARGDQNYLRCDPPAVSAGVHRPWHCVRAGYASTHTPLTSLIDLETGSLVETPDGVLEVARRFYENLYAEPTPPSADFPFVKNDQVFELCDSLIVQKELHVALVTMKRNRSPGTDGLTVEFYVKLWEVVGKPFTSLVNRLLREGTLSPTQRKGLITLLYKVCRAFIRISDWELW